MFKWFWAIFSLGAPEICRLFSWLRLLDEVYFKAPNHNHLIYVFSRNADCCDIFHWQRSSSDVRKNIVCDALIIYTQTVFCNYKLLGKYHPTEVTFYFDLLSKNALWIRYRYSTNILIGLAEVKTSDDSFNNHFIAYSSLDLLLI